jgi:UDP-N-acetyl-D-mannosaminuronic acid dehydrogenase
MKERICIMGLGFTGLPTAALLATKGYHVLCVDNKSDIVEAINNNLLRFTEPEMEAFVKSAIQSDNFRASLSPDFADIFIITIPKLTDSNRDLTNIVDSAKAIAPYIREGNMVILELTSPVGAVEKILGVLKDNFIDTDKIMIAYSPGNVLSGQTMRELVENDRIVGGLTKEAALHGALFYETFVEGDVIISN